MGAELLELDQHVVVRDACNVLKRGVVRPVPRSERDKTGSAVVTTRGTFDKVWVSVDGRPAVPWPRVDVFTDLTSAESARTWHGLTDDQRDELRRAAEDTANRVPVRDDPAVIASEFERLRASHEEPRGDSEREGQ